MKHIMISNAWEYSQEPFPAYRCDLVYGRNKRDSKFLPVVEVAPVAPVEGSRPVLPEGAFRVIKTREKGTLLVVPGADTTNRCLLFVGCAGGFRGCEKLLTEATTGNILVVCSASNACESSTEVIVLLEPGQQIAFHTWGRRTNEVQTHLWDGSEIVSRCYTKEEWDSREAVAAPPGDAEVL